MVEGFYEQDPVCSCGNPFFMQSRPTTRDERQMKSTIRRIFDICASPSLAGKQLLPVSIFAKAKRSRADRSETLDQEHCGEPTTSHLASQIDRGVSHADSS
jgi:hypothetical protein